MPPSEQLVVGMARLTWLGMLALVVALAGYPRWLAEGDRSPGVGFLAIGVLGHLAAEPRHLALVLLSVAVALAIGIPVGILCSSAPGLEAVLRPVLDAMQTVPAFSYLVIVVLLFSIGPTSAMIATVIFALPPAIRLTSLGIRQVPRGHRRGRRRVRRRRSGSSCARCSCRSRSRPSWSGSTRRS